MTWETEAALRQQLNEVRADLAALQRMISSVQLLLVGAMRQGYVNTTQREALLYAFCRLTGEENEKLAMVLVHIQPRGYVKIAIQAPPAYPPPDTYIEPFFL